MAEQRLVIPLTSPIVAETLGNYINQINRLAGQQKENNKKAYDQYIACITAFNTQLQEIVRETQILKNQEGRLDPLMQAKAQKLRNKYFFTCREAMRKLDQLASTVNDLDYIALCGLTACVWALGTALSADVFVLLVSGVVFLAGGPALGASGLAFLLGAWTLIGLISGPMNFGLIKGLFDDVPVAVPALSYGINTFGFLKEPVQRFVDVTDCLEKTIEVDLAECEKANNNNRMVCR